MSHEDEIRFNQDKLKQLSPPKRICVGGIGEPTHPIPKKIEEDCVDACGMAEARALYEVCMNVMCGCPQCGQEAIRTSKWADFGNLPDRKFAKSFIKTFENYGKKES